MKTLRSLMCVIALVLPAAGQAAELDGRIKSYVEKTVKLWASDPILIDAIKTQNAETAGYDDAKIQEIDNQWRAEAKAKGGPLIAKVDSTAASAFLKKQQDGSNGLISEVFIMDAKGLNVGQSAATSDYWQGDEPKFQQSFGLGPTAIFIDKVEYDESSKVYSVQTSFTINDPVTQTPIGAITLGLVDIAKLPK